jgi:hypothetical protein
MKKADRALSHIDQNHRQAIGSLDGDQQAGRASDATVSCKEFSGNRFDAMDYVGMNLPQRNHGPEWLIPGARVSQRDGS